MRGPVLYRGPTRPLTVKPACVSNFALSSPLTFAHLQEEISSKLQVKYVEFLTLSFAYFGFHLVTSLYLSDLQDSFVILTIIFYLKNGNRIDARNRVRKKEGGGGLFITVNFFFQQCFTF